MAALPQRITLSPDPVSAGDMLIATYKNPAKAGHMVTITFDNGAGGTVTEKQGVLDEDGCTTVHFTVPEGWFSVNVNGPGSAQESVLVE